VLDKQEIGGAFLVLVGHEISFEGRTFSLNTTGPRDSPWGKDGRLSPEPVLGDSGRCHLRTPIVLTGQITVDVNR